MRGNGASNPLDLWAAPAPSGPMTEITEHEERIAHLTRQVDDLSDVVARQAKAIDVLERRVALLMEREAAREYADGAAEIVGDERPPHY